MNQNINEIEINGVKYLRADTVQQQKEVQGDARIVVLQRGWVYVGLLERNENDCKLHKAKNLRVWGTDKGLCQLVDGPRDATKIDECKGVVEFDWLTVVHTIAVDRQAWEL